MFCIETATITGPVYDSWPPDTHFYKTYCKYIDASADSEAFQTILRKLASKLFRGPISDAEMKHLYKLATKAFTQDQSIF